jgi:aspartyl/asparaginyl-tRNA synthetase
MVNDINYKIYVRINKKMKGMHMEELSQIEVSFLLTSDEDYIDIITEKLNIIPTKVRKKDSYKIKEFAHVSWELSTGLEYSRAVSIQFEKIKQILNGKEESINIISQEYNLDAFFIVTIHAVIGDGPEVVLPSEIVKFASHINAEIDFDLYYC